MGRVAVILVDSTLVIDLTRSSTRAQQWVADQRQVLAASEVTRTEVLRGMRSGEQRLIGAAFDQLRWFGVDQQVSTCAGELGRRFRRSHDLAITDLLIAATAQVHGLPLMTSNVRHFPMFEGLQPPY